MAPANTQDLIALLKKDHADVKKLFKQFEQSEDADEKDSIAEEICEMLTVHATCEEEIVYPAAHDAFEGDDVKLVNEATIEHATAKDLIGQIESMDSSDEMFDSTVKVLSEYINHHVEEEEGEMFPKLKKSGLDLDALGEQVARRKDELINQPAKKRSTTKAARAPANTRKNATAAKSRKESK